jgi:hypothetical protein
MGLKINGQVGPRVIADGAETEIRLDRSGAQVVTAAHGRYAEASMRSVVYGAATAAAGVAPGTALSTTPPFSLWNPTGSGVVLSVLRTSMGYVSGTLGAGTIVYGFVPAQTTLPSGGSELTTFATNISAARARGRVLQGSTHVAAGTIAGPAFCIQPTLATAPAAGGFVPLAPAIDDVAGLWTVQPGSALILQGVAAAGTSPLVSFGCMWEEIPLPNASA